MPGVIRRSHVDAVMGRELRGVDRNPCPISMRQGGHFMDGRHETGHVRCAADRDQADLAVACLQRMLDRLQVDVSFI